MQLSMFIVDAFTGQPFCGNPAAVCLLEQELQEDVYQKIAKEMNLSETAFIRKLQAEDDFSRKNVNSTISFSTLSGKLSARQENNLIVLDLPLYSTIPQDSLPVKQLIKIAVGDLSVQDIRYSPDSRKLLIRLSDTYERSVLENLKVNAQSFIEADNSGKVIGVIVTLKGKSCENTQNYDFFSRYYSPWNGVAEDPVTGAAHAVLSSYWSQELGKKELRGKKEIACKMAASLNCVKKKYKG